MNGHQVARGDAPTTPRTATRARRDGPRGTALDATPGAAATDPATDPATVPASVITLERALVLRAGWRRAARTLVWTNGCFDLLHPGHLAFLAQARALGDVLVVGVNDDAWVRALKGPTRPFVPLAGRVAMLAGLRVVDHVLVLAAGAPTGEVEALRPDICCKDGDYAHLPLPERPVVEAYGGRMVLLPRVPGWSTTTLAQAVSRARAGWPADAQAPAARFPDGHPKGPK